MKNIKELKISVISIILLLLSFDVFADTLIKARKEMISDLEANWDLNSFSSSQAIIRELTLKDYIRIGLSRNPGLRSAFYKWKAELNKISVEFSLPDPKFSYTNYLESVETRVGPQEHAYSISQKIPLPDKLGIKKNRQFHTSEEFYFKFQQKKLEMIYHITESYFEYAYLAKSIAITEENINLLKSIENAVQAKYASGIAQNQDVLKLQVEIEKLKSDLLSLKTQQLPLMSRLRGLLNLPEDIFLPWPDESFEQIMLGEVFSDPENLILELKENNKEIKSLSEHIEKRKGGLKLSRREYFPDLTIGLTKIDTGDAFNPATIDSGKDPVILKFTFNIPLWFGRNKARINTARSLLQAAEDSKIGKVKDLEYKVFTIHYKLKDASRQSKLYKTSLIPKAEQTLEATKAAYEAGKTDFLSLIDVQRMLLQFQLAYYRFTATSYQKLAEMKYILGIEEF
ncbi:MAG: TolC family protein [Candidatus Aureabacteria bacterium]|nr:TolC family protein [Candidatus Auribacterota bacterium]